MKGIYKITCLQENKVYIGSSNNIKRRWADHKKELKRETHGNKFLQLDWDAYGDESFTFELIEETDDIIRREQYWLDIYKDCCYNISKNAWNPMREQHIVDKMMNTKKEKNIKLTFTQKLTESDVLEIIERVNKGESDIAIAKDYNVLRGSIWSIRTGNTWTYLHELVKPRQSYKEIRTATMREGISLYKSGMSIKDIANKLNRNTDSVKRWIKSLENQ